MESKIREAYKYYKNLYDEAVVMFRVNDNYVMYFGDALLAAQVLNIDTEYMEGVSDPIPMLSVPADDVLDVMAQLSDHNYRARAIDYRDGSGAFAIPDVDEIVSEKASDY